MKQWLRTSIGVAVLIVGVGGTIAYDHYGAKYLDDTRVYVATHNLVPNEVINATDLKQVLIPKDLVESQAITDPTTIIGKMATQSIATNQQVTMLDLEADALVPGPNNMIVPIVQNWIYSLPDSLRRGDKVSIYLRQTPTNNPSSNNEAIANGTSPNNSSSGSITATPKDSSSPDVQALTQSEQPILTNIPVEFVRNGNNQEVTDAPSDSQSTSTSANTDDGSPLSDRQNGSSDPNELELLVTPDQWALLQKYTYTNQLMFTYTTSTNSQ